MSNTLSQIFDVEQSFSDGKCLPAAWICCRCRVRSLRSRNRDDHCPLNRSKDSDTAVLKLRIQVNRYTTERSIGTLIEKKANTFGSRGMEFSWLPSMPSRKPATRKPTDRKTIKRWMTKLLVPSSSLITNFSTNKISEPDRNENDKSLNELFVISRKRDFSAPWKSSGFYVNDLFSYDFTILQCFKNKR